MPQKGHPGILRGHAAAVIRDPDAGGAPILDGNGDVSGPGVKGVFHQLLDDGGRPLHHFAGGNHIRHMGREYIDNRHGKSSCESVVLKSYYT